MMNKYVKDMINEAIEEVNGWNNPGASFGCGVAIGILVKHLDEYEKHCIEQGFDEGLECSENVIMYGNHDFVRKMFPEEDRDFDMSDLVSKYGLRIVNEKYLEYKGKKKNLQESISWMKDRAKALEKEERPLGEQIANAKIACWLDELQRYRLFLSEYQREIELTPEKNKAEQIKLLKDEIKDWRLMERVE